MDLNLSKKIALVTGSSSGIGYSLAKALKSEGCTVILNGRDEGKLREAAESLGVEFYIASNVSNKKGIDRIRDFLLDKKIKLDILICNVGSGASVSPGNETFEEWNKVLNQNLLSTAMLTQQVSDLMDSSNGSILAISSICGHAALGAPLTYSAAKAGLNSYIKGLSKLLGPKGIRVNAISPGNIIFEGSVWEKKVDENKESVEKMLSDEVSLQRLGLPEEISSVACFLVSEKASFVTGEIVVVDGGQLKS